VRSKFTALYIVQSLQVHPSMFEPIDDVSLARCWVHIWVCVCVRGPLGISPKDVILEMLVLFEDPCDIISFSYWFVVSGKSYFSIASCL